MSLVFGSGFITRLWGSRTRWKRAADEWQSSFASSIKIHPWRDVNGKADLQWNNNNIKKSHLHLLPPQGADHRTRALWLSEVPQGSVMATCESFSSGRLRNHLQRRLKNPGDSFLCQSWGKVKLNLTSVTKRECTTGTCSPVSWFSHKVVPPVSSSWLFTTNWTRLTAPLSVWTKKSVLMWRERCWIWSRETVVEGRRKGQEIVQPLLLLTTSNMSLAPRFGITDEWLFFEDCRWRNPLCMKETRCIPTWVASPLSGTESAFKWQGCVI